MKRVFAFVPILLAAMFASKFGLPSARAEHAMPSMGEYRPYVVSPYGGWFRWLGIGHGPGYHATPCPKVGCWGHSSLLPHVDAREEMPLDPRVEPPTLPEVVPSARHPHSQGRQPTESATRSVLVRQ